jgi:hypothetical protein
MKAAFEKHRSILLFVEIRVGTATAAITVSQRVCGELTVMSGILPPLERGRPSGAGFPLRARLSRAGTGAAKGVCRRALTGCGSLIETDRTARMGSHRVAGCTTNAAKPGARTAGASGLLPKSICRRCRSPH